MRRLRIPALARATAALGSALLLASGCTPPTPGTGGTPTPQFSNGLTPLVGFSPPAPDSDAPPCDYPPEIASFDWVPEGLPLPEGTYAHQTLEDSYGYHRGIFVVPATLDVFTRFVLAEWPSAGWTLGRGDSEPGEVEDQFTKPPEVGAFKAQSVYCSPGYSVMILIYAEDSSTVGINPNTQSGSPLPGATPTPTS